MEPETVAESSELLRNWAEQIPTSPLYRHLAMQISTDPDVISLVESMAHAPRHLLLFAAVQDLLLAGADDELAEWYPSLTTDPRPVATSYPPFRRFALEHREELLRRGQTRYVQTNEVRRCALLLPALCRAVGSMGSFHLVDIGTSAGLNLSFDRYRYEYRPTHPDRPVTTWGDQGARPRLTCESRGVTPDLPRAIEVRHRVGLDLHPVDPADPADRRWLEALIWPEHHERRATLREALDAARPVETVQGDAIDLLPEVLGALPPGEPVVAMHSYILLQLSDDERRGLDAVVDEARRHRPLARISLEHWSLDEEASRLWYDEGEGWLELATAQPHGEWIDLASSPGPATR